MHDGPRPAWVDRLVAGAILALAIVCVVLLGSVAPDARGYDTHAQLGLRPCGWPRTLGIPCPTCGATTAACHLVHGQPLAALAAHPFGAAVAAFGLLLAAAAFWCLLARRSYLDLLAQLPRAKLLLGAIVLLAASWLWKYLTFTPP